MRTTNSVIVTALWRYGGGQRSATKVEARIFGRNFVAGCGEGRSPHLSTSGVSRGSSETRSESGHESQNRFRDIALPVTTRLGNGGTASQPTPRTISAGQTVRPHPALRSAATYTKMQMTALTEDRREARLHGKDRRFCGKILRVRSRPGRGICRTCQK